MKVSLRLLYLYLFSFVGLIIIVFGTSQLIDLGIKTYFFPNVDVYTYNDTMLTKEENEKRAREDALKNQQRQASSSLSMLAVGLPLYLYHWGMILKGRKNKMESTSSESDTSKES